MKSFESATNTNTAAADVEVSTTGWERHTRKTRPLFQGFRFNLLDRLHSTPSTPISSSHTPDMVSLFTYTFIGPTLRLLIPVTWYKGGTCLVAHAY